MDKIRKRVFLFLTVAFLILSAIALPTVPHATAGAENVPVIDGNKTEYADCFSVDESGVLTEISLPESVDEYSVVIPDGVVKIENGLFENEHIRSAVIPDSVSTIGEGAFGNCYVLSSVKISDEGKNPLTISNLAFSGCWALKGLEIPARCVSVGTDTFQGSGLKWLYLNSSSCLNNTMNFEKATVVFSKKADYEVALSENKVTRENATFVVKFSFFAGAEELFTELKLFNKSYSFEHDESFVWQENPAIADLPVQHESYSSTVWYDKDFKKAVTLSDVNERLSEQDVSKVPAEIKLYAHATVTPPAPSANTQSLKCVYGEDSYSLEDVDKMSQLLGLDEKIDKNALVFSAYFVDSEQSVIANIKEAGSYFVSVSLNADYGSWKSSPTWTLNVEPNDAKTMQLMLIILAIVGLLAVALSISLVLVRMSFSRKKKRRELTSEEVIDKFIAAGGRTRLKK